MGWRSTLISEIDGKRYVNDDHDDNDVLKIFTASAMIKFPFLFTVSISSVEGKDTRYQF